MITAIKSTEKIVRMIEADNCLVFVADMKTKKPEIKKEIEDLFNVKVESVNTHNRRNKKLAYIKLKKEFSAADVAAKLGLI